MSEMDLGKKLSQEYEKVRQNVKKPNILLAGATGVGKSSIVNMVFGDRLAVVGTGRPVTQRIDVFETNDIDVRLFDSKGYELGEAADKEFYDSVVNLARQTNSPENDIHLIWYCIACSGNRVTDYDYKAIEAFASANIPVAVVLTKADLVTDEEVAELRKALPRSVLNASFEATNNSSAQEYNQINQLIEWSAEHLSESLQVSFIKSQKANLNAKWKKAHAMIAEHAVGAFAVGFTPIPMSDAPILVANELALFARILHLYDLGSLSDVVKTMGIGSIMGSFLSSGGKAAVGTLLKLIPGVGTIIGGTISGAVGTTVTLAFGEATSGAAYGIAKAHLNGNEEKATQLIQNFGPTVLTLAKQYVSEGRKESDYIEENIGNE